MVSMLILCHSWQDMALHTLREAFERSVISHMMVPLLLFWTTLKYCSESDTSAFALCGERSEVCKLPQAALEEHGMLESLDIVT